jgi:hypothetical protein
MGQESDLALLVLELNMTLILEEEKWNIIVYCQMNNFFLLLLKTKPMKMSTQQ